MIRGDHEHPSRANPRVIPAVDRGVCYEFPISRIRCSALYRVLDTVELIRELHLFGEHNSRTSYTKFFIHYLAEHVQ